MAEEDRQRTGTLSVTQAAALFGRSHQWVHNLISAGFIAKEPKGQYPLVALARGVVSYYEDLISKNTKTAAASRATDARTREIELRIAERRRDLIPQEDARAVISETVAMFRAEFGGLAARYTRDMDERRKLEQEINGCFERIAASADRAYAALADGSVDTSADAEA